MNEAKKGSRSHAVCVCVCFFFIHKYILFFLYISKIVLFCGFGADAKTAQQTKQLRLSPFLLAKNFSYYSMHCVAIFLLAWSTAVADDAPSIHFLGRAYTPKEWTQLKRRVTCLGRNGYWTKDVLPTTNMLPRTFEAQSPCNNIYNKEQLCPRIFESTCMNYTWAVRTARAGSPVTDNECQDEMVAFSSKHMCHMIKRGPHAQNVLFVGDSTQTEFYYSFSNIFHQKSPEQHCINIEYENYATLPCGDSLSVKVLNARNDRLTLVKETSHHQATNVFESNFVDHLSQNISLIVINS